MAKRFFNFLLLAFLRWQQPDVTSLIRIIEARALFNFLPFLLYDYSGNKFNQSHKKYRRASSTLDSLNRLEACLTKTEVRAYNTENNHSLQIEL